LRIAYADPPYIGCADKYEENAEVDHALLISELCEYDGWALSTHSPGLKILLPMCPDNVRIGAWVKPFAIFKVNVNPGYCWEPVLFVPARRRGRELPTIRDWISANITLRRGMVGVKPDTFSLWLFEILGAAPEDEFMDLFPGTKAVTKAWEKWCNQLRLPMEI